MTILVLQCLVAISEVTKQITKKNPDFYPMTPLHYDKYVVISIGSGSKKSEEKYNAKMASNWSVIGWLFENGSTPILDCYQESSRDMVDYHISVVFQALQSQDNYLRIDDDTLQGEVVSMDLATQKNMESLVKVGQNLLKRSVCRMDGETGLYKPVEDGGTNEDALKRWVGFDWFVNVCVVCVYVFGWLLQVC